MHSSEGHAYWVNFEGRVQFFLVALEELDDATEALKANFSSPVTLIGIQLVSAQIFAGMKTGEVVEWRPFQAK